MQVGSVNYPDAVQHMEINGCPASALEYDGNATVAWGYWDGQKGTVFSLYSQDFTAAELVEIAKSVQEVLIDYKDIIYALGMRGMAIAKSLNASPPGVP